LYVLKILLESERDSVEVLIARDGRYERQSTIFLRSESVQKAHSSEWPLGPVANEQDVYWMSDNDTLGKMAAETPEELSRSLGAATSLLEISDLGVVTAYRNEFEGQVLMGDGWYFLTISDTEDED